MCFFWEDRRLGEVSSSVAFPFVFRFLQFTWLQFSIFYVCGECTSWNFRIFITFAIERPKRLLSCLTYEHKTRISTISYPQVWILEGSGLYCCWSFLPHLIRSPNLALLGSNISLWSSFCFNPNTNNKLQVCTISHDWCVMCKRGSESHNHSFLPVESPCFLRMG